MGDACRSPTASLYISSCWGTTQIGTHNQYLKNKNTYNIVETWIPRQSKSNGLL